MFTLATIILKSLMIWKYRIINLSASNGITVIGIGKPAEIQELQTLIDKKHLQHIEESLR